MMILCWKSLFMFFGTSCFFPVLPLYEFNSQEHCLTPLFVQSIGHAWTGLPSVCCWDVPCWGLGQLIFFGFTIQIDVSWGVKEYHKGGTSKPIKIETKSTRWKVKQHESLDRNYGTWLDLFFPPFRKGRTYLNYPPLWSQITWPRKTSSPAWRERMEEEEQVTGVSRIWAGRGQKKPIVSVKWWFHQQTWQQGVLTTNNWIRGWC